MCTTFRHIALAGVGLVVLVGACKKTEVTPGRRAYTIEAWHEKFGSQADTVAVGANERKPSDSP